MRNKIFVSLILFSFGLFFLVVFMSIFIDEEYDGFLLCCILFLEVFMWFVIIFISLVKFRFYIREKRVFFYILNYEFLG